MIPIWCLRGFDGDQLLGSILIVAAARRLKLPIYGVGFILMMAVSRQLA
jgi:hypothetical protein